MESERAFSDIITGSIGIFSLIIIILTIHTVINAKITLDIEAPVQNDRYPFFILCEGDNLKVVCRNTYLPNSESQIELVEMCNYLKVSGLPESTSEQRWQILENFFSSSLFNSNKFYVFSFVRPDSIPTFNRLNRMLSDNKVLTGYTPVAANWNIREALRID